ncbi:hypothetical protein IKM56_03735 [Candidatus Saccharibacteria bacterium]|nr:hypothetical protein [Candidatus Saccharibacteria bacterium]
MQKLEKTCTKSQTDLYEELYLIRDAIEGLQSQIKQAKSEVQELHSETLWMKEQNDLLYKNFKAFSKQQKGKINAVRNEISSLYSQTENPNASSVAHLEKRIEELNEEFRNERLSIQQKLHPVDWGRYNLAKIQLEKLEGQLRTLRKREEKLLSKINSRKRKQLKSNNYLLATE